MAGRVADAVVTGGTWSGRGPAVVGMEAAGGGVHHADADADARPGVARAVRITVSEGVAASVGVAASSAVTASVGVAASSAVTASVGVAASSAVTASIAVSTATAVANAPAAARAGAAAETRDATPSSGPDAASVNAAAGSVATERRGVRGGLHEEQPTVVVAANGVGTPAEAAGGRGGVGADGGRSGGAAGG